MKIRDRGYRRKVKYTKERRRRNIILHGSGNPLAGYIKTEYVNGNFVDTGKHIKYPKNSNPQRFYKKKTNRAARKCVLPRKGNAYRKCSEYWHELF